MKRDLDYRESYRRSKESKLTSTRSEHLHEGRAEELWRLTLLPSFTLSEFAFARER